MCTFSVWFSVVFSVFCCILAFITSTYGYKQCISDFVFVFLSLYLFSISLSLSLLLSALLLFNWFNVFFFRDDVFIKLLLDYFLFGAFFQNWVHPWFIYDSAICIMIASAIEPYSERYSDTITATYDWHDYFFYVSTYILLHPIPQMLSLSLFTAFPHLMNSNFSFLQLLNSVIKIGRNSCMNQPTNQQSWYFVHEIFWKDFKFHQDTHTQFTEEKEKQQRQTWKNMIKWKKQQENGACLPKSSEFCVLYRLFC